MSAATVVQSALRESPFLEQSPAGFERLEVIPRGDPQQLEVIPPRDARQLVTDTRAVPYRWICSLDMSFDRPYPREWNTGFARGSGLLIGPRHVLTAAHNLYPDGATKPASVTVAPGRNGRREPFGSVKVTGWTVAGAAFGKDRIVTDFDFAVLALERDVSNVRHPTIGNAPLGHWGSDRLGQGTQLQETRREALRGQTVAVCGYPGDRCGTKPFDPDDKRARCSSKDHATTQWVGIGEAQLQPGRDRWLLHTADTAQGQSGAPLWVKLKDGSRCLVGVHVDRLTEYESSDGSATTLKPIRANVAVHLRADVLQLIRTWLR